MAIEHKMGLLDDVQICLYVGLLCAWIALVTKQNY